VTHEERIAALEADLKKCRAELVRRQEAQLALIRRATRVCSESTRRKPHVAAQLGEELAHDVILSGPEARGLR